MQEVEATCTRLIIINRGKAVADGSVSSLRAGQQGAAAYMVEGQGDGFAAGMAALPGVRHHISEPVEGRIRVRLTAGGSDDLRPQIFGLARDRHWTLWELHRERASLEELFRQLTTGESGEGGA
jgi:ABC-2 type transport system ATP-binding protein